MLDMGRFIGRDPGFGEHWLAVNEPYITSFQAYVAIFDALDFAAAEYQPGSIRFGNIEVERGSFVAGDRLHILDYTHV